MGFHKLVLLAATCCAFGSGAWAQEAVSAETVVARVNGEAITLGHMLLVRESLPNEYKSLPDRQLFDGILEQLVQQTILSQKSGSRDSLQIRLTLENDRRLMRAARMIEQWSEQPISEGAIQDAYEAEEVKEIYAWPVEAANNDLNKKSRKSRPGQPRLPNCF